MIPPGAQEVIQEQRRELQDQMLDAENARTIVGEDDPRAQALYDGEKEGLEAGLRAITLIEAALHDS